MARSADGTPSRTASGWCEAESSLIRRGWNPSCPAVRAVRPRGGGSRLDWRCTLPRARRGRRRGDVACERSPLVIRMIGEPPATLRGRSPCPLLPPETRTAGLGGRVKRRPLRATGALRRATLSGERMLRGRGRPRDSTSSPATRSAMSCRVAPLACIPHNGVRREGCSRARIRGRELGQWSSEKRGVSSRLRVLVRARACQDKGLQPAQANATIVTEARAFAFDGS